MKKIIPLAIICALIIVYFGLARTPNNFPIKQVITIDKKLSAEEIGTYLKQVHVIESPLLFKLLTRNRSLKAGEYYFPIQFKLPEDIPASFYYQDLYCNAAVKYEITLRVISQNKELMDDIIAKKWLTVYERKKGTNEKLDPSFKKDETCTDSKAVWSGKEKLLSNDYYYKSTIEKDLDSPKTEFYEFSLTWNSFCCFSPKGLTLSFSIVNQNILIGEPF